MTRRHGHGGAGLATLAMTALAVLAGGPAAAGSGQPAAALDEWVPMLEGGWSGEATHTPMGPMGFTLLFDRQDDGSLRAFSAFHSETWIELRFRRNDDGAWRLDEGASLEGLGVQRHTLVPAGRAGATRRFVHADRPDFLSIDVAIQGETLALDVWLRGERHASYVLERLPEESLPSVREQLAAFAARTPEEAGTLYDAVQKMRAEQPDVPDEDAPDPIAAARRHAANHPDDARAQMALAGALSTAIEADPSNGPRYAFELLEALETAHALDPDWADPYHGLIGYYLNAPPIAGGSVAKARELAEALRAIDPAAGQQMLEAIARRESAKDESASR